MSAVSTTVVPFPITNEQFLWAVFGDRWGDALVAYFLGDPTKSPNWTAYRAGGVLRVMTADHNNYWDVSLPLPGGGRTGQEFGALYAIVIDDWGVGNKVDPARVEQLMGCCPSYVIETSPDNYHAGWFIEPLTDRAWVNGFLRALYRALGAGDNLVKPTTLVRLPVGTNGKAGLGAAGFRVRLVHWQPDTRIKHTDWIDIESRVGAVIPVDPGFSLDNRVPDPAEIEADPILKVLRLRGMVLDLGRIMPFGWGFEVTCPWAGEHSDPRTAASYVPVKQRFKCHHGHCQDRTIADLRVWTDAAIREDSGGLETLASLEFDNIDPPIGPGPVNWKALWQLTGKNGTGGPAANLFNVMMALRHAPEFTQAFGFNAFTQRQMLRLELPGVVPGTTPGCPREWRDQDTILLQNWLQGQGLRQVTARTVDDAVSALMHEQAYHPVRDWLEKLTWDRVPRLDTWLSRYLGTSQNPYHAGVGRWWLMTMCRRVYEPGCRADYMPVLEGPQGLEKSAMLRALAGDPEWFSDSLPDPGTKEASEHLEGRWLIEIAEMDKFDRAESALMKAFVSRTTERYRRPYGRRTQDEPRQCMFAGTVNHHSYLKDETGNRRYWPVAVGQQLDLVGLALVRDQLFAEAWFRAVSRNEQYWPDPLFEDLFMQPEQDQRLEPDLWEPLVAGFLQSRSLVLVHEVVVACTGGGSLHLNTTNRNRVSRIMETLRWRRGKRGSNGERFWYPH
jgi:predicted P-loop ATPase